MTDRPILMSGPMVALTLPFPPSVNGLYRDGGKGSGRRPRTKRYLAWIALADAEVMAQKWNLTGVVLPIERPVELRIMLGKPDKRARDCTNYIKAPEDWLVRCGFIVGDHDAVVRRATVEWADIEPGARVEIWPVT